MNSNITVNIVPEGTPVPDTGLFTSGIGGGEATIIGIVVITLLATIAVVTIIYYRKKKQGTVTGLLARCKQTLKSKKPVAVGLSALALLVSIGTVAGLLKLGVNAEEASNDSFLTVSTSDAELTIELSDEPVFAVLPVDITVAESTPAGYTLTAYTENTNLISTTDSSKVIPMVTVDNEELAALEDNTYGLSLVKPESNEEETYTSLSTDSTNPTFITDKDYEATEEDDVTTIYYGFYITPDTPYGTYTGSAINYEAELNTATVIYDGNGLYFNDNEEQTTNMVKYVVGITDNTEKISHTPNIDDEGVAESGLSYNTQTNEIVTIPGAATLHIEYTYGGGYQYSQYLMAFGSFWQGSHQDYTPDNNYSSGVQNCGNSNITDGKYYSDTGTKFTVECDILGDTITFGYWTNGGGPMSYASDYGYYAVVTGYDEDGNIIYLQGNNPIAGEYQTPSWDLPYNFLGWNTNKDATEPTYISVNDVELNASLTMGETTTFYAIWQYATNITFDGNGADGGPGLPDRLVAAGQDISLAYYNDYTKTGYYFGSWNTKADGSGTAYADNAIFTAPADKSENLTLYAQWVECPPKNICYKSNGADGEMAMDSQYVNSNSQETLWVSNFSYTGHGFAGWSEDKDAAAKLMDNDLDNNPTTYGPNETITIGDLSTEGMILYAVWLSPATDENEEELTFQTENLLTTTLSDGTTLASKSNGYVTALKDERDDNVYAVAKLADGNYWMIENLRLGSDIELTSENTNNPASGFALSASSNEWCEYDWDFDNPDQMIGCTNQSYLNADNTTNPAEQGNPWNNTYSYGNYYNWYSATAGNGTWNTGENGEETVSGDICPAGWQLPLGGYLPNDSGSFSHLDVAMGGTGDNQQNVYDEESGTENNNGTLASNRWRSFPNNFVYSGDWYGSSASNRGYGGSYWSSTAGNTYNAYYLYFYSDNVSPTNNNNKYNGYSVRCVAPVE